MTEGHANTSWAEQAAAALSAAGYKRGAAREAVLSLLDRQHCALSAFDIEDALRTGNRAVARASVYRILDQLENLGLVQRVETGQSSVFYEPVRRDHEHHHHLVCDSCGKLVPFADEELERTIGKLSRRVPFEVSDHEVVLHGACDACVK
ncbi:MAG TPA: Fur family transcriptional regulator [Thermoleophilaceae bacterium]